MTVTEAGAQYLAILSQLHWCSAVPAYLYYPDLYYPDYSPGRRGTVAPSPLLTYIG
jgi:hypothetical protein